MYLDDNAKARSKHAVSKMLLLLIYHCVTIVCVKDISEEAKEASMGCMPYAIWAVETRFVFK